MASKILHVVLERDKDGTWYYVHVPKEIRDEYKAYEKRGIIHVAVTLGSTTWNGSMLPWADGSAQISIGKKIREKERVGAGDTLIMSIKPIPDE